MKPSIILMIATFGWAHSAFLWFHLGKPVTGLILIACALWIQTVGYLRDR